MCYTEKAVPPPIINKGIVNLLLFIISFNLIISFVSKAKRQTAGAFADISLAKILRCRVGQGFPFDRDNLS